MNQVLSISLCFFGLLVQGQLVESESTATHSYASISRNFELPTKDQLTAALKQLQRTVKGEFRPILTFPVIVGGKVKGLITHFPAAKHQHRAYYQPMDGSYQPVDASRLLSPTLDEDGRAFAKIGSIDPSMLRKGLSSTVRLVIVYQRHNKLATLRDPIRLSAGNGSIYLTVTIEKLSKLSSASVPTGAFSKLFEKSVKKYCGRHGLANFLMLSPYLGRAKFLDFPKPLCYTCLTNAVFGQQASAAKRTHILKVFRKD